MSGETVIVMTPRTDKLESFEVMNPGKLHVSAALSLAREMEVELTLARNDLRMMAARKDAAYEERNRTVALLARACMALGCSVWVHHTQVPGWEPGWTGCVYIKLPTGQVSWHFHDSQAEFFADLPRLDNPPAWDGHDTAEKYRRVEACKLTHFYLGGI